MLFDGSKNDKINVIRDRKFIQKMYSALKPTTDSMAPQYPFMGEFWGEKNYLRYATAPIVFTSLTGNLLHYSVGLSTEFLPSKLYLNKEGVLCYPLLTDHTTLEGVFSNGLTNEMMSHLTHDSTSTTLSWEGKEYVLGNGI